MTGGLTVQSVRKTSPQLLDGLRGLLPQLSPTAAELQPAQLDEILRSAGTTLVVAHNEGRLLGALVLVAVPTLTGRRAWIEDVVVDQGARGRGVGTALVREALRLAADYDARSVELTSRPSREAANRLYQRLGFERRETAVYRFAG
jgi:ribosomal protein S18 acetylase RimI-like enzyme